MEIIGEKQREIKLKAVQSLLLGKMENAGGTLYSYADNVIRGIVEEKDQEIRTRRILENTVNVAFVFAFADYYIRSLKPGSPEYIQFDALAKSYKVQLSSTNTGLMGIKASKRFVKDQWFERKDISNIERNTQSGQLIALCLDIASEVVRSNQKLKDLGLFQISHSATYEYLNSYNDLLSYDGVKCDSKDSTCIEKFSSLPSARSVHNDMVTKLDKLTNYVGLVFHLIDEYKYRNNKTSLLYTTSSSKLQGASVKVTIDSISTELERIIKALSLKPYDSALAREVGLLTEIDDYLLKANRFIERGALQDLDQSAPILSDVVYTIRAEFLPLIRKITHRDGDLIKVNKDLLNVVESLATAVIQNANTGLDNAKLDQFFKLIGTLYQFGHAETFSEYLKLTNDIAQVFLDEDIKDALSTVVSFVKDYTIIKVNEDGKEVVDFNVESFLVKLQNIKPNTNKRFQFLFTVGVNSIYFNDKIIRKEDTISNFSFVSEKIGVKFKFIDRAFWKTRNPGETYRINRTWWSKETAPVEPIVSNYHLLLYGSGILYNLANVGTTKDFNAPLIGGGIGITFTNSLDLNLTMGMPLLQSQTIKESSKYWYAGIGFDIQFGEYLNRLNQKRQAARTQKILTNATK